MMPILSASGSLTDFGLGRLSDCLSCEITEEVRGVYELAMTYPANGIHADDIDVERYIIAKPNYTDEPQIFKIYRISKALNGVYSINAEHISYKLNGYVIQSGEAGTALEASALLAEGTPFTITTDKQVSASFRVGVPSSVRSWFYGREGSLLDVFGAAEFHFDNYAISWNLHRGQNRGVSIRYGKNLTSLNKDRDSSNLVSKVLPFWASPDGEVTIGPEVATGLAGDYTMAYDCGEFFEEAPTAAQLQARAEAYIAATILTEARENITLDFIQIGQLKDRVDLYDVVNVYYEALGINATAKCVRTVWDALQDRYKAITIGEPTTNITDTLLRVEKTANEAASKSVTMMQEAIDHATQLITGNLGGHVVIHDSNGDHEPDEILIMDTADITTATKVWRWNTAGLGYSSTGYAGPYGLAMTMDGQIVADFIKTGALDGGLITANSIQAGSISASYLTDASAEGGVIYQAFTAADGALKSEIEANSGVMNLLPSVYFYESDENPRTRSGITWTTNADGSVTATGIATATTTYRLTGTTITEQVPVLYIDSSKKYTLSGCPSGGSASTYRLTARVTPPGVEPGSSTGSVFLDYGSGRTISSGYAYAAVYAQIISGYDCGDGVTFFPMFEVGDTAHTYQSTHGGAYSLSTSIEQNAASITATAQATSEALGSLESRVAFDANGLVVSRLQTAIANTSQAAVDDYADVVEDYIRFSGNTIELGESSSQLKARLSNTELAFTGEDGNDAAWVNNNEFHANHFVAESDLTVGRWTQQFEANGSFSIVWRP